MLGTNVPDVNWGDLCINPSPAYGVQVNQMVLDISTSFSLTQKVMAPTREGNTLDLMFITSPNIMSEPYTVPGMGDHDAVGSKVNMTPSKTKSTPGTVYVFSKEKKGQMEQDLIDLSSRYIENNNDQ